MNETEPFAVEHASRGSAAIVSVTGEIDMLTAPQLREALAQAVDETGHSQLVVDLSAVTFLSSGGLALLVDANTRAAEQAVELCVVTGSSRLVVHPMKITGVADLVPTYPDLESALREEAGGRATG